MKRFFATLMVLLLAISSSSVAFALTPDQAPYAQNIKLQQLSSVVAKVNADLGSTITIPEEEENNVYLYYKDYSLEEFEEEIRTEYEDFLTSSFTDKKASENTDNFAKANSASMKSTGSENIVQEKALRYNSTLRLKSKIYGLGSPPVYRYRSITSVSTLWPSSYTGYHYHLTSSSYSISTDKKKCTVQITGVPKNAAGLTLTTILHDTVVFSAN